MPGHLGGAENGRAREGRHVVGKYKFTVFPFPGEEEGGEGEGAVLLPCRGHYSEGLRGGGGAGGLHSGTHKDLTTLRYSNRPYYTQVLTNTWLHSNYTQLVKYSHRLKRKLNLLNIFVLEAGARVNQYLSD